MDYDQLLKGCGEVGCRLLASGAEIYRVEDTVRRMLAAYGVKGDVFAIPSTLIVSLTDEYGRDHTRLYRTESGGGTNIEVIEQFNAMSRAVCADPPPEARLSAMAEETGARCRKYSVLMYLLGGILGSLFFTLLFQGSLLDALAAGVVSVPCGICVLLLERRKVNFFFKTVAAAFVLGAVSYGMRALGLPLNVDVTVIGALMMLVPGLAFTNFMCDLMTGDALSGVSTFIRAILTATAIALGTGAALALYETLGIDVAGVVQEIRYGSVFQLAVSFMACMGFGIFYNAHGGGILLCCAGGALGWGVYLLLDSLSCSIYVSYLVAAVFISAYAEIMARVRKYPITAYLVVSYFPLVPGSYIYYTMYYSIHGQWQLAIDKGVQAVGLAASLAIGVLLVSTIVRTWNGWRRERREKEHGPV